jgi:hypothetical protein
MTPLEETAASSEQINAMASQNAENSKWAAENVVEASRRIGQANRNLEQMAVSMNEINTSSAKISKIIKVIDEIAFQTNILALNAARAANAPFVSLPAGESFETVLVTNKPWGAYNWYLGNFKSRIELNTDLPTELNNLLGTP